MSFLINLQQIDHHLHHQHRTFEHDQMDSGGSTAAIRSYDCVFCQRGFTTAQALGGHMNIHRKDRANPSTTTNKPNINPTKEPTKEMLLDEDDHDNTRLFYSSKSCLSSESHLNDGGSSSFEGRLHRFIGDPNPSSRVGSPHMLGKRIQDHGHSMEGEELDLELRLGHYSW